MVWLFGINLAQVGVTLLGVLGAYYVSARWILPFYVQRRLEEQGTIDKLKAETVAVVVPEVKKVISDEMPAMVAGVKKEILEIAPDFAREMMDDEEISELVKGMVCALGDDYLKHAKGKFFREMGWDEKKMKDVEKSVQDFISTGPDGQPNQLGDLALKIAAKMGKEGDDSIISMIIQFLIKTYGPMLIQKFAQGQGGFQPQFGGGQPYLGP